MRVTYSKLFDRFLFTPINKGLVNNQPGLHPLTDAHEFFHLTAFKQRPGWTVRVRQDKYIRALGRQGLSHAVKTQGKCGRAQQEVCDARPSRAECRLVFAE